MPFGDLYYYRPLTTKQPEHRRADVCVYGATSAGIAAAVQARRLGLSVILLEFGRHIGGMTASGLGATDIGNKEAIGGLGREFYHDINRRYGGDGSQAQWTFAPHVAEQVYQSWLDAVNVVPVFERHLKSAEVAGGRIRSITMEDGSTYEAAVFIDSSYEGDLMARAGVSYRVGREANSEYHETLNGVHFGHPNHNFRAWVDPYIIPGKPDSGLLYGVMDVSPGYQGQGDQCIQAFNFRICLTDDPALRRPFPQPDGYDPKQFELMARYIAAGVWDALRLHKRMPEGKTDLNNFGAVSTDHIGANHAWPNADYATRELIFQDHVRYNLGLLYFLSHDDSVPRTVRDEVQQWGLAADEFTGTGGWPHQLYVREARRMVSDVVMTERHCRGIEVVDDSVGLAAYAMDSHNCRRLVIDGRCVNEGNVEVPPSAPYPISYRALVPKGEECTNLIVPVCLSASHIAYGSIRMEPVFMILGQSSAIAASLAIGGNSAVQEVDIKNLQQQLKLHGQVLQLGS